MYTHKISETKIGLAQLDDCIKNNNLEGITHIVESTKHEQCWWYSPHKYAECALRDAILLQLLPIVEYLLSSGMPIETRIFDPEASYRERGTQRYSLVYFAAKIGNLAILKCLVSHGAKLNFDTDYDNSGCMSMAIRNGHADIVDYLLTLGANANGSCYDNSQSKSYLFIAVEMKHSMIIEMLLNHGADIERALHDSHIYATKHRSSDASFIKFSAALKNRHHENVRILLNYAMGVDLSAENPNSYADDFYSLRFLKNMDVTEFNFVGVSLQGVPITKEHVHQVGVLNVDSAFFSLHDYDPDMQSILTEKLHTKAEQLGAKINTDGTVNLTPVWRAANMGDVETVKCRLAAVGESSDLFLALEHAYQTKQPEIISLLLIKLNPSVQHPISGNTSLHYAARAGDLSNIRLILERHESKEYIHAVNTAGETLLHMAAIHAHPPICEYLLQAGLNPNQRDFQDQTAFERSISAHKVHTEFFRLNQDAVSLSAQKALHLRYINTRHVITHADIAMTELLRQRALLHAVNQNNPTSKKQENQTLTY